MLNTPNVHELFGVNNDKDKHNIASKFKFP